MALLPYNSADYGLKLLTEREKENPEQVFTSFFECYDLKDTREELREVLKLVVAKRFKRRKYSIEEDNVRFFFEKLEKVVEAAWVMRE